MRKQNDPKRTKKRNKNKPTKEIERIPRPFGLTLLAQSLNPSTSQKQELNTNLIQKILQYTFTNQLQVHNKQLTIQTLSTYLKVPSTIVMKAYIEYQSKMANLMLGKGDEVPGALSFLGLEKILENEAATSQQLQLLQASQGNSYKAYISSSVNEALGLKMKSTDAILGLLKILKPTNPTTLIQNNVGTQNKAIKAIGMSEALQILESQNLTQITYNPNTYLHLKEANGLGNVPEVRATHMSKSLTDGASLISTPTPSDVHANRRAKEEGLDLDNHI